MATRLVSFKTAFKYRDKILARIRPYVDTTLTGQTFVEFFADVFGALPQAASRDAVFESLRLLAGTTLTYREAVAFAWRLGGNVHRLAAGETVREWTQQLVDEWVPIQINTVEPFIRKNKPGYLLHCVVLAGSPCPVKFTQFVSRPASVAIARSCGFTGRRGKRPFVYPEYLTNLVFYGFIDASKSEAKPRFTEVRHSSAAEAYNKQLLDIRYRAQPCVRDYPHECRHCVLGYDECPAAIRKTALKLQHCNTCEKDTYFELRSFGCCCIVCGQPEELLIGRRPTT